MSATIRARFQAGIVAVAPTVLFLGFVYHPYLRNATDEEAIAAAVAADTTRWGLAHLAIGVGYALLALAFIALRRRSSRGGRGTLEQPRAPVRRRGKRPVPDPYGDGARAAGHCRSGRGRRDSADRALPVVRPRPRDRRNLLHIGSYRFRDQHRSQWRARQTADVAHSRSGRRDGGGAFRPSRRGADRDRGGRSRSALAPCIRDVEAPGSGTDGAAPVDSHYLNGGTHHHAGVRSGHDLELRSTTSKRRSTSFGAPPSSSSNTTTGLSRRTSPNQSFSEETSRDSTLSSHPFMKSAWAANFPDESRACREVDG